MYSEKVVAGFFIILSLTLNFGFVYGEIDNIDHHNKYELFAATVVNLIATTMKLGDKTQVGSVLLSTSLVADLQLLAAAIVWGVAANITGMDIATTVVIVSLASGALIANIVSVVLYIGDTLNSRR
ncbi:MAG: DUF2607 domain-containing protein [Campylobacterales bacterium]